jgi:DNA-binding transcriptional MerR regulator
MLTPNQVAKRANIHVNTVRKWSADYADLLSISARSEGETRLFSDEDVDTICTIAALRRTGMLQAQIVAQLQAAGASPVIDVAPTQAPQSPHEAHNALQGLPQVSSIQHAPYMALQRQIDSMERRVETLLRAALLWGVLLGAIGALSFGGFLLWVLYLWGG